MTEVRPLRDEEVENCIPLVAGWAYQAGAPYEDWRFGGPDVARAELVRWVARSTSEVAVGRWQVAFRDGQPEGGFAALAGAELAAARRSDLLELTRSASDGAALRRRLAAVRDLFPAVEPEHLYLSRIAVEPESRRRGTGTQLLSAVVDTARRRGRPALRLDVSADNTAALQLYERAGFETLAERASEAASLRYLAMMLPV